MFANLQFCIIKVVEMEIPEYRESKGDHTSLLHPYSVASAAKSIVMLGEQSHSGIECGGT